MDPSFQKPKLPAPKIPDNFQKLTSPHFSTPNGMLLPRNMQPPPMFGLRGSTIPAKHLPQFNYEKNQPYRKEVPLPNPLIYCDICDQPFSGEEKLEKHKIYSHPEILGIKPRVYSPEEVNEWRNERKKRYPTTQNVINRQKAMEERKKRGERLQERKSRFADRKERQQMTSKGPRRKRARGGQKKKPVEAQVKQVESDSDEDSEENEKDGLKRFRGTSAMEDFENTVVLQQSNALALLGNYSDSDEKEENLAGSESSDDGPVEVPIQKE